MDWVEFTGKNVDDALTEALISLETTSDKVCLDFLVDLLELGLE